MLKLFNPTKNKSNKPLPFSPKFSSSPDALTTANTDWTAILIVLKPIYSDKCHKADSTPISDSLCLFAQSSFFFQLVFAAFRLSHFLTFWFLQIFCRFSQIFSDFLAAIRAHSLDLADCIKWSVIKVVFLWQISTHCHKYEKLLLLVQMFAFYRLRRFCFTNNKAAIKFFILV